MSKNENSIFIVDDTGADAFRTLAEGKPFRLFRYGDIYKGGKKRTVRPDLPIKLPKFKVPLKLGSHDETTPAGGWITELGFADDGVYATGVELNEKGKKALEDGDFRYHSPEIIWEDGYIEDADTGEKITGPLLLGVALVHTPHLGEATAFYTYTKQGENKKMDNGKEIETVNVPKDFFERVIGFFGFENKPEPETPVVEVDDVPTVDEFALVQKERDELSAKLQAIEAEKERAELYANVAGMFDTDEYGTVFSLLPDGDEKIIEVLAEMPEQNREIVVNLFKALSAQIDESNLTDEVGDDDVVTTGADGFAMAVSEYMSKNENVKYTEAVTAVAQKRPDLYNTWRSGGVK